MPHGSLPADQKLDAQTRRVLRIAFVTLFLDLIGFSIIFPLFPAMLAHYLASEGQGGLLGSLLDVQMHVGSFFGLAAEERVAVLFGGFLGSLYSWLQFLFAPIYGSLSDRYGRRPVLLTSLCGIALSYALWFFAGSFLLLVIARCLGGMMSGNISTVTAAVADVTGERTRTKGMALVGIAFGLGFILGPALGGLASLVDLSAQWPALVRYGVNPFSFPALVAFLLATVNLVLVALRFNETLPANRRNPAGVIRTCNPLHLFRTGNLPGVTQANLGYFLFLLAFSGMEFSLVFLATERLQFGPRENAVMFVFTGVVLAVVQGSYVQRFSSRVGPKQMAVHGFACCIPGLALLAQAHSHWSLYCALLLVAAGAAQVTPCLSALVSLYSPPVEQGRVLGVFRSLGALARALGPLLVCVVYWRWGSAWAYGTCAGVLVIPLLIAARLPPARAEAPRG